MYIYKHLNVFFNGTNLLHLISVLCHHFFILFSYLLIYFQVDSDLPGRISPAPIEIKSPLPIPAVPQPPRTTLVQPIAGGQISAEDRMRLLQYAEVIKRCCTGGILCRPTS